MGQITQTMTDAVVAETLFERLEQRRKRRDITQQEFAEEYLSISPKTYRSLKEGRCSVMVLLTVLRQLDLLENLNQLVPDQSVRPSDVLRTQAKSRLKSQLSQPVKGTSVHHVLSSRKKLKT